MEYNNQDNLTAVVQAELSTKHQRVDYFDQPEATVSDVANMPSGYVKAGANYNIDEKDERVRQCRNDFSSTQF